MAALFLLHRALRRMMSLATLLATVVAVAVAAKSDTASPLEKSVHQIKLWQALGTKCTQCKFINIAERFKTACY